MDAFIVVDIVECRAQVSHHEHVRGENRSGSGRGSVNGKEGVDCGELAANFFFLNVEEVGDVMDHLFVRESHFTISQAIRRRRGNNVRGVAGTADRRGRVGWNEDGRGQARHHWDGWTVVWCIEGKKLVCMVDAKGAVDWRGFCEVLKSQIGVGMRII